MQTRTGWEQIFGLASVFMVAGAGCMALSLLGSPAPALGLFGFGLILIGAGLSQLKRDV
jgi:hypothetical protein